MIMKAWTHWQNWVSLVLGVILFITPWVFGTATNTASSWDAWIIGVMGVILALLALAYVSAACIPAYLSSDLGLLLFRSPWVLVFTELSSATSTAAISAILFVVLSVW